MIVRRLLHRRGYRFRIQLKGVPGRPDVALPGRRKAIFIHGCFWHAHHGCPLFKVPKTRTDFWIAKFMRNKERDGRLLASAEADEWDCLVIWECETRDERRLENLLQKRLGRRRHARG